MLTFDFNCEAYAHFKNHTFVHNIIKIKCNLTVLSMEIKYFSSLPMEIFIR